MATQRDCYSDHIAALNRRFSPSGKSARYALKRRLQYAIENLQKGRTKGSPTRLILEANTCFLVASFVLNLNGWEWEIPPEQWWGISARTAARYGLAYVKIAHDRAMQYKQAGYGIPPGFREILAKVRKRYEEAKAAGLFQ